MNQCLTKPSKYKTRNIVILVIVLSVIAIIALMAVLYNHFRKTDDMARTFYENLYKLTDGYATSPSQQYFMYGTDFQREYAYHRDGQESTYSEHNLLDPDSADTLLSDANTLYDEIIAYIFNDYTIALKKEAFESIQATYPNLTECDAYRIEIWSRPNKAEEEPAIYENIWFFSGANGRVLIIDLKDNYYILADGEMSTLDWTKK